MTEQALPQEEMVQLVNTGRAAHQIMPDAKDPLKFVTLLPNSGNAVHVPKPLADSLMRAYKHIKDAKSIFPAVVDVDALKKEHAAFKAKAEGLEKALGLSDQEKQALSAKVAELEAQLASVQPGDKAALEAKVADLSSRLQEFLGAASKKDLDALKEKHSEAVPSAGSEPQA